MKKKIGILFILTIMTCGCATLQSDNYENILASTMNSPVNPYNITRAGYKYYLPKGMRLLKNEKTNEIISHENTIYYLYVDYVSYYNQKKESYQEKTDVVYSKKIENGNSFGYIEIKNTRNDKYFLEIMYNYAKIEVIVEKNDINDSIAYAMSILSSIQYQDTTLKSLMGEDVLSSSEIEHNIFETAQTESGYLQIVEEYGTYEEKEDTVDPDFIRR